MDLSELKELLKDVDISELSAYVDQDDAEEVNMFELLQMMMNLRTASRNGQWQSVETISEDMITKCQSSDFLPLLWFAKYMLANAYRMQHKNEEALALYLQIIGLGTDPQMREPLEKALDEIPFGQELFNIESTVAHAFAAFVDVGITVSRVPLVHLHQLVNDSFYYVETIGHPEWAHQFNLARTQIFFEEGKYQEALEEAIKGLVLRQANSSAPGYSLMAHLSNVGNCLNKLNRYEEAVPYIEQILQTAEVSVDTQRSAYVSLAEAYLGLGKLEEAEDMANKALKIAQQQGILPGLRKDYSCLSLIFAQQGRLQDASSAAAKMWRISRRMKDVYHEFYTQQSCGKMRLEQARSVLKPGADTMEVPLETGTLVPSPQDCKRVKHYALAAQRWFLYAQKPAVKLDARNSTPLLQNELDDLISEATKLVTSVA